MHKGVDLQVELEEAMPQVVEGVEDKVLREVVSHELKDNIIDSYS